MTEKTIRERVENLEAQVKTLISVTADVTLSIKEIEEAIKNADKTGSRHLTTES